MLNQNEWGVDSMECMAKKMLNNGTEWGGGQSINTQAYCRAKTLPLDMYVFDGWRFIYFLIWRKCDLQTEEVQLRNSFGILCAAQVISGHCKKKLEMKPPHKYAAIVPNCQQLPVLRHDAFW